MAPAPQFGPIAVDAMGGDEGTAEVVRAVRLAFETLDNLEGIVLVGRERLLRRLIKVAGLENEERISIYNATEVIGMDEKPIQSLKQKKDASMLKAIDLVREGRCKAVVSCGNSGSLVAAGTLRLRPMEGVERPAMAAIMPAKEKHFILLDAGANPVAKAEHLVHNAILGSHYCRIVLNIANPRIGLLSNGTEEGKGNALIVSTHELLKRISGFINYHGLIEGLQVFSNEVDVIVCDGFTGNVVLKACESLVSSMQDFLRKEIKKNPIRLAGALLSQGTYRKMKDQLNRDRYGGAPLLGLRGYILKAHGASNQFAIMNAIRVAQEVVRCNLNERAQKDIMKVNRILRPTEIESLTVS